MNIIKVKLMSDTAKLPTRGSAEAAGYDLYADKWKGDCVYVIGDYATTDRPEENCYKALCRIQKQLKTDKLYEYVEREFEQLMELDCEDRKWRYVYNHMTLQYIDLEHCPIEWVWYIERTDTTEVLRMAPVPLLLAIGNGRGGDDLMPGSSGYDYVGKWCCATTGIEILNEMIIDDSFTEFKPDFTENKPMITYDKLSDEIKKETKRRKQKSGRR